MSRVKRQGLRDDNKVFYLHALARCLFSNFILSELFQDEDFITSSIVIALASAISTAQLALRSVGFRPLATQAFTSCLLYLSWHSLDLRLSLKH